MRRTWIIGAVALAACGSKESQKPPAAENAAVDVSLTAAPEGRVVVAKVDGVPIYGDCVKRQAEAHELSARAALEECIDFQLLAGEADRRGYRSNPAVLKARKDEAVRTLIDHDFLSHFATPADVPDADLHEAYDQLKARNYVHPEHRVTQYVRIVLPDKVPAWKPRYWAADAAAWLLYWHFADRRDLTARELVAEGVSFAEPWKTHHEGKPFGFQRHGQMVEEYAAATWEIPQPGMVHAPVRTQWGFDVILLVKIHPALNISFEQAEPELRKKIFAKSRLLAFVRWANSIVGGTPSVDKKWLARLAAVDEARAHLLEPSGAKKQ